MIQHLRLFVARDKSRLKIFRFIINCSTNGKCKAVIC